MSDILSLDALGQLQALMTKRISAVELLDAAVARHSQVKAKLNAVVATDLNAARERARTVDERRAAGEALGPFAGLPMSIKDTFEVEGLPASSGVKALLNRSAHDAEVVARVRGVGAIPWGKTNVPVMAGDWQSFNDLYGTTNNPWDPARVPGGSSGGAAVALSVGITALEIGSDIGGSLRVPANFCGVLSHKPTWGLVSQTGHVPPAPGAVAARDLNVVGPMARSVRDLRLLLSVIAQGSIAPKAQPAAIRGLKVGLWLDEPTFPLDPEVKAVVEDFGARLAREGAQVEVIQPIDAPALITAYTTLLSAVVATDMPAKVQADMQRLRGLAKLAMRFGADPMGWAGQVLAYSATHAEWLQAHETRERLAAQIKATFDKRDVIIAPISPVTAFPHDHRPFQKRTLKQSDGKIIPYVSMLNWIALATALGLPATVLPAGLAKSGRPVGVQIIGPHGGDGRTLAVAEGIEEVFGGYLKPPMEFGR